MSNFKVTRDKKITDFDTIFYDKFFIVTNNIKSMYTEYTQPYDKILIKYNHWYRFSCKKRMNIHKWQQKEQQHMFVSTEMVSVILIIYFIEYDCLTLTSIL